MTSKRHGCSCPAPLEILCHRHLEDPARVSLRLEEHAAHDAASFYSDEVKALLLEGEGLRALRHIERLAQELEAQREFLLVEGIGRGYESKFHARYNANRPIA